MSKNEAQIKDDSQHYDVFLSYSHNDSAAAMKLKTAMQSLGYTVFYDQDSLEGSSNWKEAIAKSIANCKTLVFLQTADSVESKWCQREVNIADDLGKKILPVAFRSNQENLPSSDKIKLALASQQTSFISDSPTVDDLKNELKAALNKVIDISPVKENGLLPGDLILAATENISSRYRSLFEYIKAEKISADITAWQISLKWRLTIGDESANIVIALNKYSKRPKCYGNCSKEKKGTCPLYAEKDRKEYSMEAYLEFINDVPGSMHYPHPSGPGGGKHPAGDMPRH